MGAHNRHGQIAHMYILSVIALPFCEYWLEPRYKIAVSQQAINLELTTKVCLVNYFLNPLLTEIVMADFHIHRSRIPY